MRKALPWLTVFSLIAGSFPAEAPAVSAIDVYDGDEASPEEIAAGLRPFLEGADLEALENPNSRVVLPSEFAKYQIVVDIFRQSARRPVLGKYDASYLDATTSTFTEADPEKRKALSKTRFGNLANSEFAIITVDGTPFKAQLISGALEAEINQPVKVDGVKQYDPLTGKVVTKRSRKTTPNGNFKLTAVSLKTRVKGADGKPSAPQTLPFPFLSSTTYDRSAMYWGLSIYGGYFFHSTPHTGQLGRPASMGCVRQSFPDAMELWDFVANRSQGRLAMIRIHKMHSLEAYTRLREIVYDPRYMPSDPANQLTPEQLNQTALPNSSRDLNWLVGQLNVNYQRVRDYAAKYGSDHNGVGYSWIDPTTKKAAAPVFPLCGGFDCFKVWGDPLKQRARDLRADAEREAQARAAQTLEIME